MTDNAKELLAVVDAAFEYIDAIPKDIQLPAMPGFDRDWAISVIEQARLSARQQASVEDIATTLRSERDAILQDNSVLNMSDQDVGERLSRALLAKYDIFEKVEK